jgi:hypothetical protein
VASCAALLLAATVVGNVAQQASNFARHGVWVRAALTGLPIAAVQLYLANPDERAVVQGAAERRLLDGVWRRMEQNRAFHWSEPGRSDTIEGFQLRADAIIYSAIIPETKAQLGRNELTTQDWIDLDERTVHIARDLALHHLPAYVAHVIRHLRSLGGFLVVLMAAVVAAGAWAWLARQQSWGLLLATVATVAVANHTAIAFVHLFQQRYVFSTDFTLIAVLVAVLMREVRPTSAA